MVLRLFKKPLFAEESDFFKQIFINEYLVAEGFAQSSHYPPDIKYQAELDNAEREARNKHKGLWGRCL